MDTNPTSSFEEKHSDNTEVPEPTNDSEIPETSLEQDTPSEELSATVIQHKVAERSKIFLKSLWVLVKSAYEKTDQKSSTEREKERTMPKFEGNKQWLMKVLRVFPYVLWVIFFLSWFWDFPGYVLVLFGKEFPIEGILSMVSVSGLIGFLTNWLAITMLFNPKQKRPILGQGLVPSQKQRIAFRLAQTVTKNLINPEIIQQKLSESNVLENFRARHIQRLHTMVENEDFRNELREVLSSYMRDVLSNPEIRATLAREVLLRLEENIGDNTLERWALKAYSMFKGKETQHIVEEALDKLPNTLEQGLAKLDRSLDDLPAFIDANSEGIEDVAGALIYNAVSKFDLHQLIEDNINSFDEHRLEDLIKGSTNDQFQYIQYIGAVLGTIGGLVIWQPIYASIFLGIVIGSVVGLDHLLMVSNRKSHS